MPKVHESDTRRVLYVDHTAEIGGGEIALFNLIRTIDLSKVTPIVLLFSDGPLVERMRRHAETHVLKLESSVASIRKDSLGWRSLLRVGTGWKTARQILKVARFVRRERVDVVHTNSLKADLIGGLAGRIAGVRVVWHVRDRIEPDYLPGSVVKAFRFLCRVVPDYVIANSTGTLATLRLRGKREGVAIASGVDIAPFTDVVHDGTDVVHDECEVQFANLSPNEDKREIRIGLIGRISPWKGQHIFIEAASLLRNRGRRAKFQIIGAPLFSEREYEAELHTLCDRLGVKDLVEFTGFVDNVSERITKLDIVVHASTTGEPFGQVIIEGMAGTKPVIATNGGGVPEIVEDGVTGMLVPMGDAVAMANAIEFLLENPEAARQMGLRGRERALAHFTIQMTARKVEAVYDQILGVA